MERNSPPWTAIGVGITGSISLYLLFNDLIQLSNAPLFVSIVSLSASLGLASAIFMLKRVMLLNGLLWWFLTPTGLMSFGFALLIPAFLFLISGLQMYSVQERESSSGEKID